MDVDIALGNIKMLNADLKDRIGSEHLVPAKRVRRSTGLNDQDVTAYFARLGACHNSCRYFEILLISWSDVLSLELATCNEADQKWSRTILWDLLKDRLPTIVDFLVCHDTDNDDYGEISEIEDADGNVVGVKFIKSVSKIVFSRAIG